MIFCATRGRGMSLVVMFMAQWLCLTYMWISGVIANHVWSTGRSWCKSMEFQWILKLCFGVLGSLTLLSFDMVNAKKNQREDIKFCVTLGIQLAVTICTIQIAYGGNALSACSVQHWYHCFQNGHQSMDDLPRSGRPSVLMGLVLNNIQAILDLQPNISMSALGRQVGLSHGTAHKAVSKTLRMKKRPAHWVPHALTVLQQACCLQICRAILRSFRHDPQLHRRLITGDESWFHIYDPHSIRQSLQWMHHGAAQHQIRHRERLMSKVIMVTFFNC